MADNERKTEYSWQMKANEAIRMTAIPAVDVIGCDSEWHSKSKPNGYRIRCEV